MTPLDQQRACAKLDGWKLDQILVHHNLSTSETHIGPDGLHHPRNTIPDYFTYNAVIPLIQKQWRSTNTPDGIAWQMVFWNSLIDAECMLFNSPCQLVEALLRATNRWKD
jgi:hypothetical protein